MNEVELVKRLQIPDKRHEAFGELVSTYQEPLYWYIRRMVVFHDDADDVLQNTFLKAWTYIDNFRGEAKLSTWLYKIATNESLNFLQKKNLTYSISDQEHSFAQQLQSDEYFDGDEIQQLLQQAVEKLPDKQRAVFNLKYFQEMKYEEMSQVLDTSTGALKASYHHAVKKIIAFLKSHD